VQPLRQSFPKLLVWNFRFRTWRGQKRRRRVHQILNAFAVNRADGKNFLEAEPGKFRHAPSSRCVSTLLTATRIGLPLAEFCRDFAVERHDAFLHVDDENDRAGRFDGDLDLFERGLDDHVVGFLAAQQADAAGVHERERFSVPLGLDAHAVARDAGLVMHDGDAPFDDAVEQRGFADIRTADDGDEI
jgi:hypothetical protein